jgi:alpha-glucosidase
MFYRTMLLICVLFSQAAFADVLKSPDGNIVVHFESGPSPSPSGLPFYEVSANGEKLLGRSSLGVVFQNQPALSPLFIVDRKTQSHDSTYTMPFGKSSSIRDHYNEYIFLLSEAGRLGRKIEITFRIYDDGFGFRYSFPKQAAFSHFVITRELTGLSLEQNPTLYGIPLPFGSSYEGYYKIGKLGEFSSKDNLILPVLLEYPSGQYVGVTEADLTDYAGMYLRKSSVAPNTLQTKLAPWPGQSAIKVKGKTPFVSPWRVFMIGNSAKTLVESNLIYNLNPPQAISDTSWIRPGKVQFPWWNGYYVPEANASHVSGINTWTLEHYIDFCARSGIPYHSIDGFDQAWYGGSVYDFEAKNVTEAIPELNLPEVLNYAKARGVGTRLWVHWGGLSKELDHALDTYAKWGVEGIMVDFLNRDDQEMVRSYHEILTKTAAHHLTVNFHGVFKPTGQSRTWPHLLNHEGVLGTEYNKGAGPGSTPEHEVQTAYIRMLAGPLDVHEGGFRPVSVRDYKSSNIKPEVMGTLARELAMYVVYENHAPMLADYPEIYEQNPIPFQFVKEVPVVWDESRLVAGTVGKFIAIARRKGDDWYIGSMTDRDPRNFAVPLSFLGAGKYEAEVYEDSSDYKQHPEHVTFEKFQVNSTDSLPIILAPAGGYAVKIHKLSLTEK